MKEKTFWAKRKMMKALDRKIAELSEELKDQGSGNMDRTIMELNKLVDLRKKLERGKISKEVWVEVLKILAMAGCLGAVMLFDARGHVLPKTLDRWLPGPKL